MAFPCHAGRDKMGGSEEITLSDLKGELASLRIDRDQTAKRPWRWPLLLLIPVLAVLGGLYAFRARDAFSAVTVETANATLTSGGSGGAAAGTPILAASGYLVARRKAVVSA